MHPTHGFSPPGPRPFSFAASILLLGVAVGFALGLGSPVASAAEPAPRWVVVTAPAFREALEPLRRHRAEEGLRVTILTTTDVLSAEEIRSGDGRKLRDHLNDLYRQGPGKTYLLLVGAARAAAEQEAAATVVPGLSGTVGRMKNQPTDNGYGCLGNDLLPTVAVGRLPARTAVEAGRMVEKILAYERDGRTEPWRRSLTLLVGNPGGRSAAEKALGNWYVSHACQSTAELLNPCWDLRAIYHIPGSPWYVPDANLHEQTLQSLRRGQAFTFYLGHSDDSGFWSSDAPFVDRTDWKELDVPHGAGVFVTCGCFACQGDPAGREEHEGYGLAAVRNPGGPVAVVGASGETYAAMGQLAFTGLLGDLARPSLPDRLGDAWLDLKTGLAKGPMDFLTFTLFDYGDGSSGKIPLAVQRQEHLEMWALLGDPALRLPTIAPEISLEAPGTAAPGATVTIRGTLPESVGSLASPVSPVSPISPLSPVSPVSPAGQVVRVTVRRPPSGQPLNLEPVADAPAEARAAAILANHVRANDPVLFSLETTARDRRFELPLELPRNLPWPRVVIRVSAGQGRNEAVGVVAIRVGQAAP